MSPIKPAIFHGITSTAMHHLQINFEEDSVAVDLLFDKYYRIGKDGNGNNNNNDGGERKTMIGMRVLDGRTGHDKAVRTGLHRGNCLASTSLLKVFVFGLSMGKTVAAGASNGLMLFAVNRAQHAVKRRLMTTIPATARPSLLS
jgi:hypothetical protein